MICTKKHTADFITSIRSVFNWNGVDKIIRAKIHVNSYEFWMAMGMITSIFEIGDSHFLVPQVGSQMIRGTFSVRVPWDCLGPVYKKRRMKLHYRQNKKCTRNFTAISLYRSYLKGTCNRIFGYYRGERKCSSKNS